ncbi:MAG: response regulator [Thermoanaerobaculia bacterium]
MPTRILLADDHEILLDGLRSMIERAPGLEVVAEARDGLEAVRQAQEHEPDLVIMDVSMPGLNGIEATRRLTSGKNAPKVLCLSSHSDPVMVEAMLEAGATGYQLKDYAVDELIRAIEVVMASETYLSPRVAGGVVEALLRGEPSKPGRRLAELTEREREVLQLISEGHSNKQIAERLHVSAKTVGTHREHIMTKLDIHTIAGLTKYAIQHGLTSADP